MRRMLAVMAAGVLLSAAPSSADGRYCKPSRVYRCACKKVRVNHRTFKTCHRVRRAHRIPGGTPVPRVPLPQLPQLPPVVPPFPVTPLP